MPIIKETSQFICVANKSRYWFVYDGIIGLKLVNPWHATGLFLGQLLY